MAPASPLTFSTWFHRAEGPPRCRPVQTAAPGLAQTHQTGLPPGATFLGASGQLVALWLIEKMSQYGDILQNIGSSNTDSFQDADGTMQCIGVAHGPEGCLPLAVSEEEDPTRCWQPARLIEWKSWAPLPDSHPHLAHEPN